MKILPLDPEQSPLLIFDLLFKLKVRDVMSTQLVTITPEATLRSAQQRMKERGITGLPVVESDRLLGIVSMHDILTALDLGYINDPIDRHMPRNIVVLDEEMPLSLGITYFDKYRFGRFPVLNREKRLVGILTTRDISAGLLKELFKEVDRLQTGHEDTQAILQRRVQRTSTTRTYDFENAGRAAHEIKKLLVARAVDPAVVRRVAVAAYELEMNQIVHSNGGTLRLTLTPRVAELVAHDQGPGIADVAQAMQEGFTTANDWIKSLGFGAGMGLPNVQRVSDKFEIHSALRVGTTVRSIIFLSNPPKVKK